MFQILGSYKNKTQRKHIALKTATSCSYYLSHKASWVRSSRDTEFHPYTNALKRITFQYCLVLLQKVFKPQHQPQCSVRKRRWNSLRCFYLFLIEAKIKVDAWSFF
ncbi:hypothetical protein CEXT_178441 [Caerostris extrusa]|uniref:Uncharacterized protein n=1 Tax=Caerostris extrusa TaxID=172846 RepID=A0AAV4R5G8_CAEEX|nr:hypothetical protein CEXT_178441 [Caerostris extrusa]